jgi:hypothetical protein
MKTLCLLTLTPVLFVAMFLQFADAAATEPASGPQAPSIRLISLPSVPGSSRALFAVALQLADGDQGPRLELAKGETKTTSWGPDKGPKSTFTASVTGGAAGGTVAVDCSLALNERGQAQQWRLETAVKLNEWVAMKSVAAGQPASQPASGPTSKPTSAPASQAGSLADALADWIALLEKDDLKSASARWSKDAAAADTMKQWWTELKRCHKEYDYSKWLAAAKAIGEAAEFEVGGHSQGHLHVSWERTSGGWRIAKVWICR